MKKPKSYYMLHLDVESHYTDELTAVGVKPELLLEVLRAKLSQDMLRALVPDPAEITLSRIEGDDGDTFRTAEVYSLLPYIEIRIRDINHTYWYWDEETDDEKEYSFPRELAVAFDADSEMLVKSPDDSPLSIAGVENPGKQPLRVSGNTALEEVLDSLWERDGDDLPFGEWNAEIILRKGVLDRLCSLEGPPGGRGRILPRKDRC